MEVCQVTKPKTSSQILYDKAVEYLGQEVTLDESIPFQVRCAEAVSFLLEKAGFDRPESTSTDIPFRGIPGTWTMWQWLKSNPLFREVQEAAPGRIIISPSGTSKFSYPNGHVGICGKNGILSNDSNTGLFLEFYDIPSWNKFFGEKRGFPVYYFEPI